MPGVRQHRRVDTVGAAIRADVWLRKHGDAHVHRGIVTVLSMGGLFIRTSPSFTRDTCIGLRFYLPTTGAEIICSGIVRDSRSDGVGVEFSSLTPSDQEHVHAAVLRAQSEHLLRFVTSNI